MKGALVALAVLAVAARADADDKDRCIADSETGQRLVLTRHFVDARAPLVACGGAECPAAISADCIERLHQAEASAATVVLVASGADRALVDGTAAVIGQAVWVDPGVHRVRFERGGQVAEVTVTVAEGARLQRVTATFASAVAHRSRVPFALAIGGGVALLGGGAFGLAARSYRDDEHRECGSPAACSDHAAAQRDYDRASTFATASTVAVIAGGALLATAAVWWWRGRAVVTPVVGAHEGGVAFVRAF